VAFEGEAPGLSYLKLGYRMKILEVVYTAVELTIEQRIIIFLIYLL